MDLNEFYEGFWQEIDEKHRISGNTLREEFFNTVTEKLSEADEIIDEPVYTYFESYLSKNKRCQIDGYSWNEVDGVLSLYISSYTFESDIVALLDKTTANRNFNLAKNFLMKANEISEEAETSNEGYDLAYSIDHAFEHEDNEFYNMNEVKIVILTDKSRASSLDILEAEILSDSPNIKITYQIYDINILYQLNISKNGKAELVINFTHP
ncbi:MAG: AIPR family protein, partial [Lactococcus cremoris]